MGKRRCSLKSCVGWTLVAATIAVGVMCEITGQPRSLHGELGWLGNMFLGLGLLILDRLERPLPQEPSNG